MSDINMLSTIYIYIHDSNHTVIVVGEHRHV